MPKLIANLGDVNPIDYGGFFVYDDGSVEVFEVPEDWDEEERDHLDNYGTVYRFNIDRCTYVDGVLSSNPYHPDRLVWWAMNLTALAADGDTTEEELIECFCSEDLVKRAVAYRELYHYCGPDELDSYPLTLARSECEERYKEWRELRKRGGV